MNALVVSPIFVPLATAFACMLLWKFRRAQRAVSLCGGVLLLAVSVGLLLKVLDGGVRAVTIGGWTAPYGITMVADTLGAIMVLLNGVVGCATVVYSLASIGERRERNGYHPLMHCLLAAVSGAFLTADIFNLYVWFEVMLMSSFVLLTLGGERGQLEGALKYVALNLLSSCLFLSAVGLTYGLVGSLNMADIAVKLAASGPEPRPVIAVIGVLFMAAFGIKAALFPFFFWLPASYHTPAPAVSALFAGLLTKVGVYALIRVFTLIFAPVFGASGEMFLWIAALTMVTGVLGAAAQFEFRRILSFHIVSQIGYMVMGLAVGLIAIEKAGAMEAGSAEQRAMLTAATISFAGAVFYILHHIIVKTNLFYVAGIVHRLRGTGELKDLGGLYADRPYLSLLFMVPAMSLAGIPILSGFWAKLTLVIGAVRAGEYWIVGVALVVSVLTLYSMTKIWAEAFWKPAPEGSRDRVDRRVDRTEIAVMTGTVAAMAAITLTIGVFAGPAYRLAERAAGELMDRGVYIRAVLGEEYLGALPEGIGEPWMELPAAEGGGER